MSKTRTVLIAFLMVIVAAQYAGAGTLGHYYPGVMGMRDIILPPKGLYGLYYDPIYYSSNLKNASGNSYTNYSTSFTETKYANVYGHDIPIRLTAGVSADIDASMSFATQQLLLIWVPGWKFLGADYGMTIAPSTGYVSVKANVKAHGTGTITVGDLSKTVSGYREASVDSSMYGFGDLLAMPVMLDWRGKRYDLGLYYGFWAPTGAYSENRIANVGMGFWTQQFQAFYAYYFDDHRKTALVLTGTYNFNSQKYDQPVAPGQSLTLEYALSHYLTDRVEVGVCGYDQWQISADHGPAAQQKNVFYQIHGIGGQIGGWVIKDKMSVTTKCIAEYYGVDRFQGVLGTVNVIWVF